jgi:hypothetical protein
MWYNDIVLCNFASHYCCGRKLIWPDTMNKPQPLLTKPGACLFAGKAGSIILVTFIADYFFNCGDVQLNNCQAFVNKLWKLLLELDNVDKIHHFITGPNSGGWFCRLVNCT